MTRNRPAKDAGGLAGDAIEGVIASSFIVPIAQVVLLETFQAMPRTSETGLNVLRMAIIVLTIIPVISTICSAMVAYVLGGLLGVIGYFIVAISVSAMIGANGLATVIFVIGFASLLIAFTFKEKSTPKSGRRF